MAHTFLKANKIVSMGLGMLRRDLILPRLVTRMGGADFVGAANDTVTVRVPAILSAREYGWRNDRSSAIVTDDLQETSTPVLLDKDPYSAVAVTDEQLTLDIVDFSEQVLQPQMRAVAEKLESYIATTMSGAPFAEATINLAAGGGTDWDVDAQVIYNAMVEARRYLNIHSVPVQGRIVVMGADVEAAYLKGAIARDASQAGTTDALNEAVIGRKAGFTIIGNVNSIPTNEAYAFHPSAFVFANMAPVVPAGVSFGQSQSFDGLALRWIRDYDATKLQDRSVVSSFAGTASVNDGQGTFSGKNIRAVKIRLTAS